MTLHLRRERMARGLTQERLAELADLNPHAVQKIDATAHATKSGARLSFALAFFDLLRALRGFKPRPIASAKICASVGGITSAPPPAPMITANCRDRFTAADFDFVASTLSASESDSVSLVDLLTDAEARDSILDNPRLFKTILENGAPLSISPQLYFYILSRHVLKETGINDLGVSDYVASLLETFSETKRMRSPADGRATTVQYVSDMLVALQTATPAQSFLIRAHVGNYTLFITGLFAASVQSRAERGAPGVGFYEDVGSANYKAASCHRAARSASLSGIYENLADRFHDVRLALNRLSDSLIHLDEPADAHLEL